MYVFLGPSFHIIGSHEQGTDAPVLIYISGDEELSRGISTCMQYWGLSYYIYRANGSHWARVTLYDRKPFV